MAMLGLIVLAIMMGFPTAFTLMGLGMIFGFTAFWNPGLPWFENRVFDLMVQRTYGVMTNDTLLSVPLFVLMGYVMERAALVDEMFHSVQLAFRRVPASLAVTTLLVCAFWGIASGIVGAVVVLMGVIAMGPMLKAGYDVKLASGAITAGGTLGILIPPSVMLIVYAAVAGQSIVKLYAAAMLPGFFLTFLYLVYILGWAILNPKIAPKLPANEYRVTVPDWLRALESPRRRWVVGGVLAALIRPDLRRRSAGADGQPVGFGTVVRTALVLLVPIGLAVGTFGAGWWYVVIHNAPEASPAGQPPSASAERSAPTERAAPGEEKLQELGVAQAGSGSAGSESAQGGAEELSTPGGESAEGSAEELTTPGGESAEGSPSESEEGPPEELTMAGAAIGPSGAGQIPPGFFQWFWGLAALTAIALAYYYSRLDGEQLEILAKRTASVVPLGVLTFVVLAVILFGITTASESAAVGVLGALFLAVMKRYPRRVWLWSLGGAIAGVALGIPRGDWVTILVAGSLGGTFAGTIVPWIQGLRTSPEMRRNLIEAVFLTAKTTAMVCWLFVGSSLFSGVFALHGGQALIEKWVLGLNLSPLGFLVLAQLIIFLLGWPLEWTEIIVIFCPIFIPLLGHFSIDPILFGTMVAVNLQAAFLSPPVAMSAFYLKGVAPKHVTLNQIFAGMMPYMLIVCLCLVFMYIWPGMTLWLPEFLYGK